MSDTEQLFILAGVWTAGALFLAYFIPNWWAKIAAVALLVGVPFWELPFGYYSFMRLCSTEGGLRVVEAIAPQRTICAEYPFDSSAASLLRFGFETVEARAQNGDVSRFPPRGDSFTHGRARLVSEYCVTFVNNNRLPWRIVRHDFIVTRLASGSVAARHSVFDWLGMWWQAAASPLLGRGGQCREDPIDPLMSALRSGTRKD